MLTASVRMKLRKLCANVSPVEIVEERQQVERQLDPSLALALVQRVGVHDARGVVQAGAGHHRPVHIPAREPCFSTAAHSTL